MEKYRADWSSILKFDVEKETERTIWYNHNGRLIQQRKDTEFYKWFDTFEEAKQSIIDRHKKRINRILENLKYENRELEKAEALIEKQQIV